MQDSQFDVAIVGASISGATLAIHLGQQGVSTVLIDKDRFPRRKACGEGVSDIALNSLSSIGFDTDIRELKGLPFHSYRLDFAGHSFEFASGREKKLKGIGIQRYLLDKALIDKASTFSSVSPLLETTVTGISKDGERFILQLSSGKEITAQYLALACGVNCRSATQLDIPQIRRKNGCWGISFALEGSYKKTTKEILVLLKDGFEIYCTPVSKTRLNVAFLTGKKNLPHLQELEVRDKLLREAMEKCFFEGELVDTPLVTGPLGTTKRTYRQGSVILLGDTAESYDPISGMGITHGILSAELAAKALISIKNNNISEEKALDEYAINCEKMGRLYRGFTRLTGGLLRSRLRNILIPVLVKTNLPHLIRKTLKYHSSNQADTASFFTIFLRLVGK